MTPSKGQAIDLSQYSEQVRPLLSELIGVRVETRSSLLSPLHLLLAAGRRSPQALERTLSSSMRLNQSVQVMLESVREYLHSQGADPVAPESLSVSIMSHESRNLMTELRAELPAETLVDPHRLIRIVARLVFKHLSDFEADLISYFIDVRSAGAVELRPTPPRAADVNPIFEGNGKLNASRLTAEGHAFLQASLGRAAETGYDECQLRHLALAALEEGNSLVKQLLHVYGRGTRLGLARASLFGRVSRAKPVQQRSLHADAFAQAVRLALSRSTFERMGAAEILLATLRSLDLDPIASRELREGPLALDVEAALSWLERSLLEQGGGSDRRRKLPSSLASCENLTAILERTPASRYYVRSQVEQVVRGMLSRDRRCVIVHGESGVGRSAIVEAAACDPRLSAMTFARLDAGLGAATPALSGALAAGPDLDGFVLVAENLEAVVAGVKRRLKEFLRGADGLRLIGVLPSEVWRNISTELPELQTHCWAIEIPEADRATTVSVLGAVAPDLEREFEVAIDTAIFGQLARLADEYVVGGRQPSKAIRLLRMACDEEIFTNPERRNVDLGVVNAAIARETGFDHERIAGSRSVEYFIEQLSQRLFGQAEAVKLAAEAIYLARGSARSDGRPAASYLFMGQTGTGKTLAAKEIARLYSPHGELVTFPMADFKERHSVATLLGAPPGYKGYGDRIGLVQALLDHPNSVLLFDEIEKAHPEVLDVLLQLLAEGWVRDAGGRTARATQTMVVLTSNACQQAINQAVREGKRGNELARTAVETLYGERHHEGGPLFKPELLGRMDGIVVFRPMALETLEQIARHEIEKLIDANREQLEVDLVADDAVWNSIAKWVAKLCENNPKHARAVGVELRRFITIPLARLRSSGTGRSTVRVELDSHGGVPNPRFVTMNPLPKRE